MFNIFKKSKSNIGNHRYKNLSIDLPTNWKYELEPGDQQACYDPKSQSTLRIHILLTTPPEQTTDQGIQTLTAGIPYLTTSKGLLLTNSTSLDTLEENQNITLVTWRLINNKTVPQIIAVLTYTVLTVEKDSIEENEIISMINNSLQRADLT
ncbi:MAG TPA: hypothetical protein VKB19_11065 [Pedobacter sp.]|nr:hypothetical protein [Pedobacter sp.]